MDSFRKAYGALKDSTTVSLVRVNNSQFKDLDIAVVKATNHDECPPKERYVRRIFAAVSPEGDAGYCIYALSKRFWKTHNWIVAVKTLIVFHRLLREGYPNFKEQLVHISRRGNIFHISTFKDESGPLGWDCSAWVRSYGLFLEERVECLRKLNYDIEVDRVSKSAHVESDVNGKDTIPNPEQKLLDQLPLLQQLLYHLLCCQPEGLACCNFLIQYAFALVVKESFKIYCAINDKIINMLDTFFEMPKHDAIKALEIYTRARRQANQLADFYAFCRKLELTQTFQFPILTQPPPTFLATMEEYIKEAPQTDSPAQIEQEGQEKNEEPETSEERSEEHVDTDEPKKQTERLPVSLIDDEPMLEVKDVNPPPNPVQQPVDLLDLNDENAEPNQVEETNPLALAIIPSGNDNIAASEVKNGSWELELFTEPSNINQPQVTSEPKMVHGSYHVGSFNRAFLDSLYEDDASRRQLQLQSSGYSTVHSQNPFDQPDPFAMASLMITTMPQQQYQTTTMFQQQQMTTTMMLQHPQNYHQQNMMMMMVPYNNPYAGQYEYHSQQQHMPQVMSTNPFADPFDYSHTTNNVMPANGNHMLS